MKLFLLLSGCALLCTVTLGQSECCSYKKVGSDYYNFLKRDPSAFSMPYFCSGDCVYTKDPADGIMYCFKDGGMESQCLDNSLTTSRDDSSIFHDPDLGCRFENTDFTGPPGTNIQTAGVDISYCFSLIASNTWASGFTYNEETRTCFVKKNMSGKVAAPGIISWLHFPC